MNELQESGAEFGTTIGSAAGAEDEVRYGFQVGPWHLLFEPALSGEVIDWEAVCRLPNAAPWFVGLVNVRSTFVPVFDLESALLGRKARTVAEKLLVLGSGRRAAALLLSDIPRRINLGSMPPSSADHLRVTDPIAPYVTAAYALRDRHWLELDYGSLFKQLAADGNAEGPGTNRT